MRTRSRPKLSIIPKFWRAGSGPKLSAFLIFGRLYRAPVSSHISLTCWDTANISDGDTMANSIPDTPDALLTRGRTAEALTEAGFPVKAKTLATKATRGGGPPYRKFGQRAIYRWGDALAWAEARVTAAFCNTSEQDAAGQCLEAARFGRRP